MTSESSPSLTVKKAKPINAEHKEVATLHTKLEVAKESSSETTTPVNNKQSKDLKDPSM